MPKLILASRSPRRIAVLKSAGYTFTVVPSKIDEHLERSLLLEEAIQQLAAEKGEAITAQFPDDVILSADTMVVFGGKVIGKPNSKEQAREWLKQFSGTTQEVVTGYSIIHRPSRTILKGVDIARLTFRKLTEEEIENYVVTDEPYDKAGGYNIEETAKEWVDNIDGLKTTILGLPLEKVAPVLEELGISPNHKVLAG